MSQGFKKESQHHSVFLSRTPSQVPTAPDATPDSTKSHPPSLCNGARLCIKKLMPNIIEATIMTGHVAGLTRRTGCSPALPCHPGRLNDSRSNSSSTEVGVIVGYQRPRLDPLRRMYVQSLVGVSKAPPLLYPQEK
ncbi:hypothetical protein AVEN_80546-1 [Araneus ventricosus]|uniref:Uncharacterized protein n=1 Tax=Araneus ventricosus TaxID=182803 RepID=A0A4Y2CNE5_ARAVE|nr:hypothetical protein AVEN_80546-1 [Araneus ventricosus]